MTIDPKNLAGTATLTFDDEFNGNSLDLSKWKTGYSWMDATGSTNSDNHEQQWYINAGNKSLQNLGTYTVADGVLDIKAQPSSAATQAIIGNHPYTSGMITTQNSFSQTFGYFEMRAETPAAQGAWPAFWMLNKAGGWPPELDVMEATGQHPTDLLTSSHTGTGSSGHTLTNKHSTVSDMSEGFHTYGVDWEADKTTWYYDGKQVFQAATPSDMHSPMYMLANLAVGGSMGGTPSAADYPAHMKIDYIRAYSSDLHATPAVAQTPSAPTDTAATGTSSPAAGTTGSTSPAGASHTGTGSTAHAASPPAPGASASADPVGPGSTDASHTVGSAHSADPTVTGAAPTAPTGTAASPGSSHASAGSHSSGTTGAAVPTDAATASGAASDNATTHHGWWHGNLPSAGPGTSSDAGSAVATADGDSFHFGSSGHGHAAPSGMPPAASIDFSHLFGLNWPGDADASGHADTTTGPVASGHFDIEAFLSKLSAAYFDHVSADAHHHPDFIG
jgi:beta-glucanase (GH16 family)